MDQSYLAANLLHLRTTRDWPLELIAQKTGLSARDLESYENCESDPTVSSLRSLCDFFEVGIDDLLFRDLRANAPAVDELLERCEEYSNTVASIRLRYEAQSYQRQSLDDPVNVCGRMVKSLLDFSEKVVPVLDELTHFYVDLVEQQRAQLEEEE